MGSNQRAGWAFIFLTPLILGLAGTWQSAGEFFNAGQRLVKLPLEIECIALKLTILETFGNEKVRIFAGDVK